LAVPCTAMATPDAAATIKETNLLMNITFIKIYLISVSCIEYYITFTLE
jgi:hypothetical protein